MLFREKISVYFIVYKFSLYVISIVNLQNKIECLYAIDIDSIDDVPESTSKPNCAASSMDEFRKELSLKREARHRAIAAVSSEMERLRKELDAEKEAHSETSSMLAQLRSAHSNPQDLANDDFVKATKEQQRKHADENEKALKRAEAQRLTRILKVLCSLYDYP